MKVAFRRHLISFTVSGVGEGGSARKFLISLPPLKHSSPKGKGSLLD